MLGESHTTQGAGRGRGVLQCLSEYGNDLEISVSLLRTLFINVTRSEHCDMPFKLSLTGTKPQICSVSDSKLPKHPVSSLQISLLFMLRECTLIFIQG